LLPCGLWRDLDAAGAEIVQDDPKHTGERSITARIAGGA
jgi:hypothetical protein